MCLLREIFYIRVYSLFQHLDHLVQRFCSGVISNNILLL